MKDKILPTILSLLASACLVSGHASAQDFAFYFLAAMNALAWIGVFVIDKMSADSLKKITATPIMSWSLTFISVGALVYSGHEVLAASSLVCSLLTFCGMKGQLKKLPE